MTAIQHKISGRITLLLVIACMIAGLIGSVACDEFYNSVLKSDGCPIGFRVPDNSTSIDCIVENATQISFQRPEARKSGYDQVDPVRPGGSVLFSSAGLNLLNCRFYLFILLAILIAGNLSYFHILFIHQKDGQK